MATVARRGGVPRTPPSLLKYDLDLSCWQKLVGADIGTFVERLPEQEFTPAPRSGIAGARERREFSRDVLKTSCDGRAP